MLKMRFILTAVITIVWSTNWSNGEEEDSLLRDCPPSTCKETESIKQIGIMEPHCQCDENCHKYGDCCYDAPNKPDRVMALIKCHAFSDGAYYVKHINTFLSHCNFRSMLNCLRSYNYTYHGADVKIQLPVTAKSTNVTYGNIYCAICDNVSETDITFWHVNITCGSWSKFIKDMGPGNTSFPSNYTELNKSLVYNKRTELWQYKKGLLPTNCSIHLLVPKEIKQNIRPCYESMKYNCPISWNDMDVTNKCEQYQSIVHQRGESIRFKNVHCAECNGVPPEKLYCQLRTWPTKPKERPNIKRSYLYVSMKSDCTNLLERINLKKIQAETVIFRTMNRTFVRNSTTINGTNIQVCRIGKNIIEEIDNEQVNTTFFRFIVDIGCLFACTFLLAHIWNFFAAYNSKMFTDKLMCSYTVALLIGNVGFLYESISNQDSSDRLIICAAGSTVTYYGFLASFLWMISMTFDISSSVWSFAFNQPNIVHKNHMILFVIFSVANWIIPAVITIVTLIIGSYETADNAYQCLLRNITTLLCFFIFPLIISISVNFALYSCTLFVVLTEFEVIDKMAKARFEFKMRSFFIILSNFMWLVVILAGYFDNHSLIVLFAVCDVFLCWALFWASTKKEDNVGLMSKNANIYSVTKPVPINM